VGPRVDLEDVEKRKFLTLPGLELRTLDRPACSHSLYRLCYKEDLSSRVTGSFTHGDEHLDYINGEEFLDQLNDYYLVQDGIYSTELDIWTRHYFSGHMRLL
jgi:hypothetical protein